MLKRVDNTRGTREDDEWMDGPRGKEEERGNGKGRRLTFGEI